MPNGPPGSGRGRGRPPERPGEWVRPAPRGRAGTSGAPSRPPEPQGYPAHDAPLYPDDRIYDASGGWEDATWPGEGGQRRARPRSAIHDPWREPRQVSLPTGLPTGPTIFIAIAAVVLAFLLGRATGGGGNEKVAASTATTVESTTPTTGAVRFHTVQENESLSGIAAQYGLSVTELAAANNISNVNSVQEGQRLVIPAPIPKSAPSTAAKDKGNE